jgi:elongation factor G
MDAGIIRAKVPLAELYQYSAALKSITKGAGTYTMDFSHYEAVPRTSRRDRMRQTGARRKEKA